VTLQPNIVHAVERGMNLLTRAAEFISAVLLWLIFAVLLTELALRNLFTQSLAGSWEVAAFIMSAMFYLGLAPALRADSHVRVLMLSSALKGLPAKLLEAIVLVLALAVSGYASVALVNLSLTSLARSSKSWELSLPLALPQAFVALGMAIFACAFAARLVLLLAGARTQNSEHGK
jgi:TRAP-type C4-dicarboxylate transport system permease small subunit